MSRPQPYVVIVTGTRRGMPDVRLLHARLDYHKRIAKEAKMELQVFHGDAYGVDAEAKAWAKDNAVFALGIPALWAMGDKGGPLRNEYMVDLARRVAIGNPVEDIESGACFLEGFPDKDSIGTRGCIAYAQTFDDIKVRVTEV